ncbi:alpha-2-macroglobulin family protein [Winogradskyella sediminis]|uniref:Alpha-2-macroglobulin family N-terminal region n=1 Tax=Winogradskyella sediminis TaxID=1382466 RepID=A0A1H1UFK7_9FLAO|nr:MG2 domain-containing protein [Winogradskyella sediminis]SDS70966.1 Alpha-2-macroglobulin family N-terminal region [Winogradskyella sediminis]
MKNYTSILVLICFALFASAQNDFDKQWKEISKLENEGLTKSASALADVIYKKAVSAHNTPQRIKALLHISKYLLILEEDAQLTIVNRFKTEIESASDVVNKHLLENMLATMYWQYFQQHRYQFYDRTKTTEKVSDDFRTWDLETLFNEIHWYYQLSLQDADVLQQESLNHYSILLHEAENSKSYRPTLFDLLSHNALEFYKTDENSITQPSYKFTIDNPDLIADSDIFTAINLTSKDTLSLQRNALKIYQNLLKFHNKDQASKAFVNVDIERLNFVAQHGTFSGKDDLLIKTLQRKSKELKTSSLSTLYDYEIAKVYKKQGDLYNNTLRESTINTKNRWKLKEAITLCIAAISRFPNSLGAQKSEVLIKQIHKPSLQILTEEFIGIHSPSRILVTYKNLNQLDFEIYKVSKHQLETFNNTYRAEVKEAFFKKLNLAQSFSRALKTEGDYQNHSTEIVLPNLTNGLYIVKANTNSEHNVFATADIQVTDLALIESSQNDINMYQVIDRHNGKPLINIKAEVTYSNNNNKQFTKSFTTDRFGKFEFSKDKNYYRNVQIKVKSKDDTAYFGDYFINRTYNYNKGNDTQYRNFIFTDRSIYRPGQIVYFKGIATKSKDGKTEVSADETATLKLKNVNGEIVKEMSLQTNEFGSVHGEFILPNDGLTGNYTIELFSNNSAYANFSVEEYKRPKFKPEFQPITETYKVNDSIIVNGTAIAFAGSNITDAKVVYRVKRYVRFPSWYYWRRPYFNAEAQEITFGETKTNAKGEFEIAFKALPDDSVSKDNLPVFNYEITADVTDINGETHSTSTNVYVGYHALTLHIDAPQNIDKTQKEIELSLASLNLNGQFAPAKGELKIYKLNAPNRVLRPRPWQAPDYQMLSKDEFVELFPHDPYDNEGQLTNWPKGKEVYSTTFDTEKEKTITLKKLNKWDSGQYIIVAESKDKFGQTVTDQIFTSLFSDTDKTIADNQLYKAQLDKDSYDINSMAKLTLGSAAKNITITVEIEKGGKIIMTQLVELNNSKKTISIPVLESDLGGFAIHTSFAAFNAFKSQSFTVNVPYPKTDLEIETTTFRDKLQPGQDETWSFKVKGPKGDKVAAELLASMYDASLDEFRAHNWNFSPINNPVYYGSINKNSRQSFGNTSFRLFNNFNISSHYPSQRRDELNWFGFYFGNNYSYEKRNKSYAPLAMEIMEDSEEVNKLSIGNVSEILNGQAAAIRVSIGSGQPSQDASIIIRGVASISATEGSVLYVLNGKIISSKEFSKINPSDILEVKVLKDIEELKVYGAKGRNGVIIITTIAGIDDLQKVKVRTNLNETAFFLPQLQTDKDGNVSFNFTAPEVLTKWKLQLLAHTKTLESAISRLETVTQKELMVIPNAPRFLREGDDITISTKIANLTEKELSGVAQLILTDAVSGKDISEQLVWSSAVETSSDYKNFTVNAKGNTQVSWQLKIPQGLQAVQYKIIAKAGDFSDGEQNALPVLSNRMLVTETLPMWIRSNETKTFTLDKLKNQTSSTLTNHKLTLEMTSNPAWYAVQALPYLMEYPYDCNEQTFSRYYANALAQHIVTSNPRIQAVFNQWKSTDALLSNLEKNQELKSLLIQETPWLRDAQSETEQKKRIALLFDLNKMTNELQSAIRKLETNQHASGAWPWFNGGRDNRFITQHIIAGFGHLKQLNVSSSAVEKSTIHNAVRYLDAQFIQEYKDIRKYNKDVDLSKDHLSHTQLHYLYTRSFYPEIETSSEVQKIMDYYQGQIQKYWLSRSLYAKGLMALTMHRTGDAKTAGKIIKSLKENSITSDELGMYWKSNTNSWHWYQAPVETQALMVEVFSEVGTSIQSEEKNLEDIDNLKIWLLKNKQTNRWKTTKATTEAVYALLLQGSDWLSVTEQVDVKVGNEIISPSTLDNVKVEAGTGYFKTSWTGSEITPEQADVSITKKGEGIAWGALYWQYFEDLDKITSAETPLKLSKKLFLKSNTDKGEEITEITSNTELKVGDLISVRIELRTDRTMEFVHLKDMRAAGLEPINVLSQYKWQDGLGYYESTKDAATNFFMDYLPKGVYVFEYDLRVNNAGDMSNGISTIQSMYAPEFSSHSEGVRITVD